MLKALLIATKNKTTPYIEQLKDRRLWIVIGAGQLLSLLICGTAIFSELIVTKTKFEFTQGQAMITYWCLFLTFLPYELYKMKQHGRLESNKSFVINYMWKYMLIAFLEVEGNYMAIAAYKYTSAVSVQILDCMAIPTSLLLSILILKERYYISHYAGTILAILGAFTLFFSDSMSGKTAGNKNSLSGNALAAGAGILYGVVNVLQEFLIKKRPLSEYLFALGLFGSCISTIQCFSMEFHMFQNILEAPFNAETLKFVGYLTGFVIVMYLFSILMPTFIRKKLVSAVSLNLSLQTSDIYTLIISLVLFEYKFAPLYLLAWLLIMLGSIIFHLNVSRQAPDQN